MRLPCLMRRGNDRNISHGTYNVRERSIVYSNFLSKEEYHGFQPFMDWDTLVELGR
jgi:hypothetical protein